MLGSFLALTVSACLAVQAVKYEVGESVGKQDDGDGGEQDSGEPIQSIAPRIEMRRWT
jgi:hypothetical protein